MPSDQSDRDTALDILKHLTTAKADGLTPGVAVELAGMLLHLAGGDGRGVYRIHHNPTGDMIPPPWAGLVDCHGIEVNVKGASVAIASDELNGYASVVFDEMYDLIDCLESAAARATWNAVNDAS